MGRPVVRSLFGRPYPLTTTVNGSEAIAETVHALVALQGFDVAMATQTGTLWSFGAPFCERFSVISP